MGKARSGPHQIPNRPRKAVKGTELAKKALEAVGEIDRKVIGFVQAFQKNMGQLYTNTRVIGDLSYTGNIHATVLRQILIDKGLLTEDEYKERVNKEIELRDTIQKKQEEEARQAAENLKKKQAEEAAARIAEVPAPSEEETVEPKIFGGNLGTEENDGKVTQGE